MERYMLRFFDGNVLPQVVVAILRLASHALSVRVPRESILDVAREGSIRFPVRHMGNLERHVVLIRVNVDACRIPKTFPCSLDCEVTGTLLKYPGAIVKGFNDVCRGWSLVSASRSCNPAAEFGYYLDGRAVAVPVWKESTLASPRLSFSQRQSTYLHQPATPEVNRMPHIIAVSRSCFDWVVEFS